MTKRPISYDKNQLLDQQGHLLAGIRFPNQLQLAHVKSRHQSLLNVGNSDLDPQPRYEE